MRYIRELDGFRALAILPVLALHGFYGYPRGGFLGVDLFFVLSGFLITSILAEEHEAGGFSLVDFYARRALRILPPLIVAILLALAITPTHLAAAAAALLFYANLVPEPRALGALQHTWSLSLEEHFYLVWPLFFLWLGCWRIVGLIGIIAAIVALRLVLVAHGADPGDIQRWTFTRIDSIAIGCLAALLLRGGHEINDREIVAVLLLAIGTFFFTATAANYAMMTLGYTGFPVICALAIVSLLSIDESSSIRRALASPVLRYIGKRSYGLYLYHYPVFIAVEYFRVHHDVVNLILVKGSAITLTFAIAEISYRTVEAYAASFNGRFRRAPIVIGRSCIEVRSQGGSA